MCNQLGQTILIYTDGACSGNPGKGGWGAIVYSPEGRVTELGSGRFKTTNNQMELTATIEALEFVEAGRSPYQSGLDQAGIGAMRCG